MRLIVTGAAGFLGSSLTTTLLRRGHTVVGIDRLSGTGAPKADDERLTRAWSALTDHPGFEPAVGDLLDLPLEPLIDGADAVVHLAGRPGTHESWADFGGYLRDNVHATGHLLDVCGRFDGIRFLHGSSSSVYGRSAVGVESAQLRPASPYAVTKLAAEATVRTYSEATGLPTTILRFFSVYGPGQRPDMGIYRVVDAALRGTTFPLFGDGSQTRTLTFVQDLVDGICGLLDCDRVINPGAPTSAGQTYNLGGTEVASMLEVIEEVGRQLGQAPAVNMVVDPPGNQQHVTADSSRAAAAFGFAPSVSLVAGLAQQIDWQKSLLGGSSW